MKRPTVVDAYSPERLKKTHCLFSVIQYSPDVTRGEFINIGIAIRDPENVEQNTICLTKDWTRVQWPDPQADIPMLCGLEEEWQHEVRRSADFIDFLVDGSSGSLQLTTPKGCLVGDKQSYVELLMQTYVDPAGRSPSGVAARSLLYREMRSYLENRGLWREMTTDLRTSLYTHPGNPLRIDCGYKTVKKLHCIHAVSLLTQSDDAIQLAFAAEALRAGVLRVDGLSLDLMAIVESPSPRVSGEVQDRYSFYLEMMTEAGICAVPLVDIARVEARVLSEVA
jgi:hypothetical protein